MKKINTSTKIIVAIVTFYGSVIYLGWKMIQLMFKLPFKLLGIGNKKER